MLFVNQVEAGRGCSAQEYLFSVHCHNDLGMATAATVESYFAGATQLEVALNGLGERCGNTNAYEVPSSCTISGARCHSTLEHIYETAILVSNWSGIGIYSRAPLIGQKRLYTERYSSGWCTKTKGMKKGAYRPIDYALIGRHENDSISFTSQSGRTAVYEIITSFGYHLTLDEASELQPIFEGNQRKRRRIKCRTGSGCFPGTALQCEWSPDFQ
jgi:2-isopropylmalate synthase